MSLIGHKKEKNRRVVSLFIKKRNLDVKKNTWKLLYYTSWADFNKTINRIKIKNNKNIFIKRKKSSQIITFFLQKEYDDEFCTLVGTLYDQSFLHN